MATQAEITALILALRDDNEKYQEQIYIVSGVLGGVCLILLICIFIMFIVAHNLSRKMKLMEEKRRIDAELNARKFSAYTGEEVHRRLQSAVPIKPNTESEYAFNNPVSADYELNRPPTKF